MVEGKTVPTETDKKRIEEWLGVKIEWILPNSPAGKLEKYLDENRWSKKRAAGILQVSREHFSRVCNMNQFPSAPLRSRIDAFTGGEVQAASWE